MQTAKTVALALALAAALGAASRPAAAQPARQANQGDHAVRKLMVYVSGSTERQGGAIHRYHLDLATGALTAVGLTPRLANPSFLALHPSGKFLYAVNEVYRLQGKRTGAVSAFAIGPKDGDLQFLNQQLSGGAGPCHLVVDRAGRHVLAANYGGGSVCVLPIGEDGKLGEATATIQHEGRSVDPKRQTAPHAHSINLDAANRFAFAADLGLDQIRICRFDAAKGTLAPNDPPFSPLAPGAGPRHFAFHPDGRTAYAINEMGNTVAVFRYDPERGALEAIQTLSTLPEGFAGESYTAEVQVHPRGKFLYGSNRGHNSLAIFAIDPATGKLTPRGHQPVGGDWPRHFGIDPTGTFLLAANRRSNNLVVFRIDPEAGLLEPTGHVMSLPDPTCVVFLRFGQ